MNVVLSSTMTQPAFTPFAALLVTGYLETSSYSRDFKEQHGFPPNTMSKSQHLRSVVQAAVQRDDGMILGERWVEFGRVEITVRATGDRYVFKSERSLRIEQTMRQRERLFDANTYLEAKAMLLVYRFHTNGVDLSLTGAVVKPSRQTLRAAGEPSFVGTWPYNLGEGESFNQDEGRDAFGDLGDLGLADEDEGP